MRAQVEITFKWYKVLSGENSPSNQLKKFIQEKKFALQLQAQNKHNWHENMICFKISMLR